MKHIFIVMILLLSIPAGAQEIKNQQDKISILTELVEIGKQKEALQNSIIASYKSQLEARNGFVDSLFVTIKKILLEAKNVDKNARIDTVIEIINKNISSIEKQWHELRDIEKAPAE